MSTPKKDDRLMIRISPEVKELLEKKAATLGMNMSEYVRLLILEDVRKSMENPPALTSGQGFVNLL